MNQSVYPGEVGLMKAESEFGELCEQGAKKVFPDLVITAYKVGEAVSSQALVLKSKEVQGVLNATYEGDMSNMLTAFAKIAFAPRIGGNDDLFTEKMIADHGKLLTGALSFSMPHPLNDFCSQVASRDSKHNISGCAQAGMAYLHVKQLYTAVESCSGKGVDCQVNALLDSPADSTFGFVKWEGNHQALYNESLRTFAGGKFAPLHG